MTAERPRAADARVFVSHAHEDRVEVDEIVAALERRGIGCWVAPRDEAPGEVFTTKIATAITKSRAMLLVLSGECNESEWVLREVRFAIRKNKRIIPIAIDGTEPAGELDLLVGTHHRISLSAPIEQSIDECIRALDTAEAPPGPPGPSALPKQDAAMVKRPPSATAANRLRIAGLDDVMSWNWDQPKKRLGRTLLGLDKKWIREKKWKHEPGSEFGSAQTAGTAPQWSNIFWERPQHWRLLVDAQNKIVGYWELHLLFKSPYDQLKAGELSEDDLAVSMMPSSDIGGGSYPAYLSMIGADASYRGWTALKMLLQSLFDTMRDLAEQRRMFISEITARAWTDDGAAMCQQMGMDVVLKAQSSPNIKIDHWCGSIGDIIEKISEIYDVAELRKLYAARGLLTQSAGT